MEYNFKNAYMLKQVFACLFLSFLILLIYFRVTGLEFIYFDDDLYVYNNEYVNSGLSFENIKWAFSLSEKSPGLYWQPLTWLSHMVDVTFFGLSPGPHHFTSVMFHILNACLLFYLFYKMSGCFMRSLFVAVLFAVHPLNVDSVAWIAERKNVLSTLIAFLTIISYYYYVKHQKWLIYAIMVCLYFLGLAAKPMLVTLPFALLLLDFWPLNRIQDNNDIRTVDRKRVVRLVVEKIPLFFLAFGMVWFSTFVLDKSDNLRSLETVSLSLRIMNAVVSYTMYIVKLLCPVNLAIYYPFPDAIPLWQFFSSLLFLIGISVYAFFNYRKHPYFIVGWLWYLGTLFPVSGIVQAGLWPAMADRWVYIPLIGLFIIISWGITEIVSKWRMKNYVASTVMGGIVFIFSIVSFFQVQHWKNNQTLFAHTLAVTQENEIIHTNWGVTLLAQGKTDEAIQHFLEAFRINQDSATVNCNLGRAYETQNQTEMSIRYYTNAIQINPDYNDAHYGLANQYFKTGQYNDAVKHYKQAIRISPMNEQYYFNLGNTFIRLHNQDAAIDQFLKAIAIKPGYWKAHYNLATALMKKGEVDMSMHHFREMIRLKPDFGDSYVNLANLMKQKGDYAGAIRNYRKALTIKPTYKGVREALAKLESKNARDL